jgi:hypothetical protein
MSVLVYIRKLAMNRVYFKCDGDGELFMLITKTEVNINYYKLDNIKSCLKFKQSADKRFTVYLQHYTICRMQSIYRTLCIATAQQAGELSEPCELEAASVRKTIASENIHMPRSVDKFKHVHNVVAFLNKKCSNSNMYT